MGILHHLELQRSLEEIRRVLKIGGRAAFLEPLGHNPMINLFRALTPKLRSQDEHPLTAYDLSLIAESFSRTQFHRFHLLSFLALPFLKSGSFANILDYLDNIEEILFDKIPYVGKMAWQIVVIIEKS